MDINTYSLGKNGSDFITRRITVKEMASIINGVPTTDEVKVKVSFLEKVEKFADRICAKTILISSGYRDEKGDRLVGGNGKGTHTKGYAIDVCFKDANGKTINPELVCIVAQDTFGGVARIGVNYIHLDDRSGKQYLGDETRSYNTVTDDFKEYFGRKLLQEKGFANETIDFLKTYKYANDLFFKILK